MKLNSKFFAGLSVGLLIGFITFGASTYVSTANDTVTAPSSNASTAGWIPVSSANQLIQDYSTNIIQNYGMPENSSIGGTISKDDLKKVAARSSDDQIKFRFFFADGNTGIVFFPQREGETAFQSGSFCPPMCD